MIKHHADHGYEFQCCSVQNLVFLSVVHLPTPVKKRQNVKDLYMPAQQIPF